MAESMIGTVVVVIVLIVAVTLVSSHYRRGHHREPLLSRLDGHRLRDRVRHWHRH